MTITNNSFENLVQLEQILIWETDGNKNEESMVKLLLLYLNSTLENWQLALEYSNKFHERLPHNGTIFLLNVFSEYSLGGISNSKLNKILNNEFRNEIKQLLYLVAVLDLESQKSDLALKYANLISESCNDFVYLFRFYMRYYRGIGKRDISEKYKLKLIHGIHFIFLNGQGFDPLNIDCFLNERVKGKWLSKPNFEFLLEDLIKG